MRFEGAPWKEKKEGEPQGKWWTYSKLGAIHERKWQRNDHAREDETSSKLKQLWWGKWDNKLGTSWLGRIQEERNEISEVCMLKQERWSSWLEMIKF